MKHRAAHDRAQTQLLPEAVEDYVGPEHPVRFLDAFVAQLDLHTLGFAKAIPAHTGRPPYDPGDLLRLYLYGYGQRLRSSRALERECYRNLELRWLLRGQAPDHKTIADFRRDHRAGFKLVHRQFHLLCHDLGLLGGELLAVDGTKLAGVNSRDRNFHEKKLTELLARADARLAEYTAALDAADATENAAPALTRAQLEEKIAALQEKQTWHKELLERLEKEELKQLSTTDPDARKMPTGVVGYNAQSAVDAKHKRIVAATVTNEGTDLRQLATVAVAAKETLQVERLDVVADKGYDNNAEVSACAEAGLTAYLAKPETSANAALGLSTKKDFTYDADQDVYRCPAGAELTHRFNTYEKERALRSERRREQEGGGGSGSGKTENFFDPAPRRRRDPGPASSGSKPFHTASRVVRRLVWRWQAQAASSTARGSASIAPRPATSVRRRGLRGIPPVSRCHERRPRSPL